MRTLRKLRLLAVLMSLWISFYPMRGLADDINIFVGTSAGANISPNVLIVLDNTSNWSRQSQQWPGGVQQGQSEVRAINTVINSDAVNSGINVGLFEFVTEGNASSDTGGKVRYAIQSMTAANKTVLSSTLTTTFNAITDPLEKRNSGTRYGDLMNDVYSYYAGAAPYSTGGITNVSRVDSNGYSTPYTQFKSPLSSSTSCAKNFIIFIANPDQSGPTKDSAQNLTTLGGLGGNTSQLALPNFTSTTTTVTSNIGNSTACYSTRSACTTAETTASTSDYASSCTGTNPTYSSCACTNTVTDPGACAAGTQRYSVLATNEAGNFSLGTSSSCYASSTNCTNKLSTDYSGYQTNCTGTGLSCSCTGSGTSTGCSGNNKKFTITQTRANTTQTNLGYTQACYSSQSSCSTVDYAATCATYNEGCACSTPTSTGSVCAAGTSKYAVGGTGTVIVNTPTGTSTVDTATYNADEWSRFLYQKGIPVSGSSNQTVATYTIDVYNAQPNAVTSSLLMSMAKAGGGKYFNATNEAALVNDLKQIFAEILSINSMFASASLPVNATNRAQNENQVFIGMFRPDPIARPRWYGNLKRYQLILAPDGVTVELGDANGLSAVNSRQASLPTVRRASGLRIQAVIGRTGMTSRIHLVHVLRAHLMCIPIRPTDRALKRGLPAKSSARGTILPRPIQFRRSRSTATSMQQPPRRQRVCSC